MKERTRVLIERLIQIDQESVAIDVRPYETGPAAALRSELVPRVRAVGEDGLSVLGEILSQFDPVGGGEELLPLPPAGDPALLDGDGGSYVADLAFVGRMELASRLGNLAAAGADEDRWSVLTLCEDCLRKTRKAASAVEAELARRLGRTPRIRFTGGLSLAREIRRHYGTLRREVERAEADPALTLDQRIRTGTTCIARLVGREVYPRLRVGDRVQLRRIQERLRGWMEEGDARDPETGRQLWHDLKATAALLGEINRRSELLDADRQLVRSALEELAPLSSAAPPSPELAARLHGLRGRDGAVDALLDAAATTTGDWTRELERLRRELHG